MYEERLELALEQAKEAFKHDEIPVGCVIFKGDELIGCGYNKRESSNNAIMHAEIIAIDEACRKLNSWRLDDCSLYVTLKPCIMCMGAIVESRIKNVYYGTENNGEQLYDFSKVSKYVNLINMENSNCSKILSDFFQKKRKK